MGSDIGQWSMLSMVSGQWPLIVCLNTNQQTSLQCRVVLEELEPGIQLILEEHNRDVLGTLLAYVRNYMSSHVEELPVASVLPLSGFHYPVDLSGQATGRAHRQEGLSAAVVGALQQYRKAFVISSPFVAISGDSKSMMMLVSTWLLQAR